MAVLINATFMSDRELFENVFSLEAHVVESLRVRDAKPMALRATDLALYDKECFIRACTPAGIIGEYASVALGTSLCHSSRTDG